MLFYNKELLTGKAISPKNKSEMFYKVPFLSSHGYLDDRVRLQMLKYCPQNDRVERSNLISDNYFRDKLFFVTPKLKFSFYEELKKHKKNYKKELRIADKKHEFNK